jgi:hypothetical protein
MHWIYENVDGVLVWVGEVNRDSDLVFYFIAGANGYDSMDMYVDLEDGEVAVVQEFEYFESLSEHRGAESTPILVHKVSNPSPATEEALEDVVRGSSLPHTKTAEGRQVFGLPSLTETSLHRILMDGI